MQARAKLLGHPVHQSLIAFPLGGLGAGILFDIVGLISGGGRWHDIAYWVMLFGVITGLIAAVFGLIDWLAIPGGTRAKRVGAWHGGGNVLVVALFVLSLLLRWPNTDDPSAFAILLGFIGFGLAGITGWLGGELVGRLGVGVHQDAHLDATSSLSQQKSP